MWFEKSSQDYEQKTKGPFVKKIAVIIVAAGRGSRAGEGLPKQYRPLLGEALIRRTIINLAKALPHAEIVTVIHPDDRHLFDAATVGLQLNSPVSGGATRQASVLQGLKALTENAPDFVLVHDAARPFVDASVINGVLAALETGQKAVVPGFQIVDTLNRAVDGKVNERVNRDGLYSVQTPQGFDYEALLEAHLKNAEGNMTDDGAVMEENGHSLHLSRGNENNFKVTHARDFRKAEAQIMMELADVRVGSGYDVHRFETGDKITLCGHSFPHERALKGHSDADVGLHALTDALLAAIAEGDIGAHFPPSEEKWRGVESHVFLKHAKDLITARGGVIANVSVCVICERPKIGPHKEAMRAAIADILQVERERVSVQATTTEKLGFTGREEGIAAQATATVRLPLGGACG
jgi:2-C-methyl-D-erythritol 4-phosphate cytidylyltransferase/2-C-methyl-D-erythritol 2,4-cyclodiphosphate synthase